MATARLLIGDVFDRMAEIPDGSIDLVLTSPPFLALRSYLPADHPDKGKEIGSEPTPAAFLNTLLALSAEWRRVLAPHGSICVELGDTYSGSGGGGGDYLPGGMREHQPGFGGTAERQREGNAAHWRQKNAERSSWPLDKSLCGIPHLYHLSLAYGRNLLTGEPSPAGEWRVRNVVAWCRPNPPVGALGDKVRPATSYLTIACTSRTRYFDLDAIREPHKNGIDPATMGGNGYGYRQPQQKGNGTVSMPGNANGAPPLDHWWHEDEFDQDAWLIPTQPYSGSHYATWPAALCTKPIRSMVPPRVCTTCGEPSRRITKAAEGYADHLGESWADRSDGRSKADGRERNSHSGQPAGSHIIAAAYETTGWTDCGHDTWRTGVVLDPFAGSGTTLAVATGEGREAIGIDLDARNAELVRERVGMFLEVDEPEAVA